MILPALGTITILCALAWIFGGFLLRAGGALVFWVGLLGLATTGNANALLVAVVGALAWLAGYGHYRLRRGAAKSPLAEAIFTGLAALWWCLVPATDVRPATSDKRRNQRRDRR